MSQYGRLQTNYYLSEAKFNSTRDVYRYAVIVYASAFIINLTCRYSLLIPNDYALFDFEDIDGVCNLPLLPNPIPHYSSITPFDFLTISNKCITNNLIPPTEFSDYFLATIPVDTSVTGSCLSTITDGMALDYTPNTPPAVLTELYQEIINNKCITNNLIPPTEFSDYFLATIPVDTSVTGNCLLNVIVDQTAFGLETGVITNPQTFSFETVTNSCLAERNDSDLDDFNTSTGQNELPLLNFGSIDGNCTLNLI